MCISVSICAHVYVRQGTCVLCMYVCRYLGSVCGSLAVSLAPGGGCEGVNKENEEVLCLLTCLPASDPGLTGEYIELGDHNQRLLFNTALLFWLLGGLAHFPY